MKNLPPPPPRPFESLYAYGNITTRDHFATQAMLGFLTNRDTQKLGFVSLPEIASAAYQMADAMLEARKA